MLGFSGEETLLLAITPLLVWSHWTWFDQVQSRVPDPYLDEVFHIPQAQRYCEDKWFEWDDKITTPPGL